MERTQFKTLFTQKEIEEKVRKIGGKISTDFRGKTPVLVGILKGAFVFLADLIRNIEGIDLEIDFIGICSYGKKTFPEKPPEITKDLAIDIKGRDVIVIEDIIDTGGTLKFLIKHMEKKNPSSVKICTLIDKRGRRKGDIIIDYVGFVIEYGFVIGYGLDFSEKFRNIKEILIFTNGE